MNKYPLIIGIVTLFILSAFVPMSLGYNIKISNVNEQPSTLSRGKTLYVGGTGEGNYTKIQDAIDNASDWDIVFVYSGIYYESIKINKPIQVIGENRLTTIIDGEGSEIVVEIESEDVLFKGFTVQNATHRDGGFGIDIERNFVNVNNNIIRGNKEGILVSGENSRIIRNHITNNLLGIRIDFSNRNIIHCNNFIKNTINALFFRSYFNSWEMNYWDKGIGETHTLIFGLLTGSLLVPWINIDWFSAKEPYDIGV